MHNETELEVRLTELAKSREPQPTAGGEWLDLDEPNGQTATEDRGAAIRAMVRTAIQSLGNTVYKGDIVAVVAALYDANYRKQEQ